MLTKKATEVLLALTTGLDQIGDYRRIGGKIGGDAAYRPVCVERIGYNVFAVTHYFQQNGDLVCDPEVVFLRAEDQFVPVSVQHAFQPIHVAVERDEHGEVTGYRPRAFKDLCSFVNIWMRNIRGQQGLRKGQWSGEVYEKIACVHEPEDVGLPQREAPEAVEPGQLKLSLEVTVNGANLHTSVKNIARELVSRGLGRPLVLTAPIAQGHLGI